MSPDEIKIPPEPPGRCSNQLQVGMSPLTLDFFKGLHFTREGWYLGILLSIFAQLKNPALEPGFYHTEFMQYINALDFAATLV